MAGRKVVVRGALVVLAGLALAGAVYVLAVVPPNEASFYPRCMLHTLTGLHCPGCGITRALHAVLNGRIVQAIAYNALIVAALPVVAVALVRELRPRPVTRLRRRRSFPWAWVLLAVMLLYGVLRNAPIYPFTVLAPHEL